MSTKLERLLDERGISLPKLAEEVGFAYSTVYNFATGRTDASQELLKKIGDALRILPNEVKLLAREEPNARVDFETPPLVKEVPVAYVVDPEIQAINGIWKFLDGLSPDAKKRVMDFVNRKLGEQGIHCEPKVEVKITSPQPMPARKPSIEDQ